MKITVAGIGYVGLANAVLLASDNQVMIVDIDEKKVNKVNQRISPIKDNDIEFALANKDINIIATLDANKAYKDADYVIIATPTNYNEKNRKLETESVEQVIQMVYEINTRALVIIRSTVSMGFTEKMKKKYKKINIVFMPEFLREGNALYDSRHPSRIIIGSSEIDSKIEDFVRIFCKAIHKKNVPLLFMESKEAEMVKLFSNAYLAMRVSFFNELDTFSKEKGLNTLDIINGVCSDERIGKYYNNPSFGYGGSCLPKDTKQLLTQYKEVPNCLMKAIVEANSIRKKYLAKQIVSACVDKLKGDKKGVIGIFRLISKNGNDNCRNSAICDLLNEIKDCIECTLIIYEPTIKSYEDYELVEKLEEFKHRADFIIANRYDECLESVKNKVFTRDLTGND